jgi:outer membrane protein TolC
MKMRSCGGGVSFLSAVGLIALLGAMMQAQVNTPVALRMPQSHNPFAPYIGDDVPEPDLGNSPRLDKLIRDGKLYLSLKDAIDLALENNLDLAIARYNLPIADTDLLRTKGGGSFRGINTGVVQGTPGGGVGGYGAGAPGAGAGGTTGGAGGAGAGASGLVQSTLGTGTTVLLYDPSITVIAGNEHQTSPLSNLQIYGVPSLQLNTTSVNVNYSQAFGTGSTISIDFDNNRQTTNSPDISLSPALNSYFRFTFQQQLLAGFGFGPNLRYLRIAKNNKKISDIAFQNQVTATVTQIQNIYWDLVSAYEQARVFEQSVAFANQSLDNSKKQLQLESGPEMDVMKAEAEVVRREQDLTLARTNLELQESLIKNALTKTLNDPVLEEMPVVPTDHSQTIDSGTSEPILDLIARGLQNRPELLVADVDLANRQISQKAVRNALLPTLSLVGFYGGTALAGEVNAISTVGVSNGIPNNITGAWRNDFNYTSPDYYVGFNLNIPLRNRVGKADQYRAELEYRQAGLRKEQLKKLIRIEIRNAQYALEQSRAIVDSARKSRDLAERTFEIMKKEQGLGAGSSYQTATAQRDLSVAELALVNAMTTYEKAKVELDRATGATLEHNGVLIQDAVNGKVTASN